MLKKYALLKSAQIGPHQHRTKAQIRFERRAKKCLRDQIEEAIREGDDDKLINLIGIKKTLLLDPLVQGKIKVAEIGNDHAFFKKLGKAISSKPKSNLYSSSPHHDLNLYLLTLAEAGFNFNSDVKVEKLRARFCFDCRDRVDANNPDEQLLDSKKDFLRHLVRLGLRRRKITRPCK